MVSWTLIFTLMFELTYLRGKIYYSDCSPDKTLVNFAISGCEEDECDLKGGELITILIDFKPQITVNAGKAKMCVYKSKPVICHPGTARIPDICEKMTPKCPMEPGRVYTYEHVMRTPNISLRAPATYKLYNEKCNVIACVEFIGELSSPNKDLTKVPLVDNSQPCKD